MKPSQPTPPAVHVYVTSPHSGPNDDPLYTVGFYNALGKWHPLSDHVDESFARAEVIRLNGGDLAAERVESIEAKHAVARQRIAELETELAVIRKAVEAVLPDVESGYIGNTSLKAQRRADRHCKALRAALTPKPRA